MNNILVTFICLLSISNILSSQTLSFDNQVNLLEFPSENLGLSNPVFPIDFNEDGITDLMRKLDDDIFIYQGEENGEFGIIDNDLSDWNWIPLKSMDYDNDGDLDMITTRYVIINEGNGQFTEIKPSFNGVIIEAADFNDDGYVDLLTHSNENNTSAAQELIILFNQGDDTFINEVISSGLLYGDVDLGDIDNDGDIDIVSLDYLEDFPILILTNENTFFSSQKTGHTFSVSNSNLYLTDLDNDSDLDIITNSRFEGIFMIENDGNLWTNTDTKYYSTPQIIYFKHADLNDDGKEDLVFYGGNSSNSISIYTLEGKGNFDFEDRVVVGSFERPAGFSYPNGNYLANNINLFDYDQDNKIDILHTDGYSMVNQFALIRNNTILLSVLNNEVVNQNIAYPNPAMNFITVVRYGESNMTSGFKICNSFGQIVLAGECAKGLINVSNLKAGNYLVLFENNSSVAFTKI